MVRRRKWGKSKVERAGAVLGRWLQNHKRDGSVREYTIQHRWADLVGDHIAQRTQPGKLRDGLLTVVVASAAWLNELTFMRGSILKQINEMVGYDTVRAIHLVAGRVRPPPVEREVAEPPPEPVELPPQEVERIERELASSDLDPELRASIRRARLAQLGRLLRFKD